MNSALTILTFKQGRRGWTLVNSMPILKHQFMFDKPCREICTFTGIVERISKFEIGSAKLGLNNYFTHLGFEYRSSSIKNHFC